MTDISVLGRDTQGVKLITVSEDETLIGVERIPFLEDEGSAEDDAAETERPPVH